ncbi:hypothetical protein [Paenibacillus sp. NEAU-GSW1]|uniref:hypothetical protein n=1 Tax=Paenibacillus sp. NEAU-GSW1 TaxID=2682486 RepID=UPI0012E2CEAC|nr:hypothetical protein [Paenibacillus sp. NEAU-GSW1]MUT65378.1 hypothetical protein [Paenibacillus sp. NEAU-GSW1]
MNAGLFVFELALQVVFLMSIFMAYRHRHKIIASMMIAAFSLEILSFILCSPFTNSGDWLFIDGWLFYATQFWITLPLFFMLWGCWFMTSWRKGKRKKHEETLIN